MAKKNLGGRPTVMTPDTVKKLDEAFSQGFSDVEACLYADISKQALYDYCKLHPEYTDRKEELKHRPLMRARININKALQAGDKDMSKWYAERKAKQEFSLKVEQEIDAKIDTVINIVPASKK